MTTTNYTRGKLSEAVDHLATGKGVIKERLKSTASSLLGVKPENLPSSARAQFEEAMRKLTSGVPIGDEGAFVASVNAMSEEEAVAVARKILGAFLVSFRSDP